MYQAFEVEQFAPGHHGYPRASETRYRQDLEGPLWHPVSWLHRADRSSISSFHLADLGGKAIDIGVSQSLLPSLMLDGDDARLIGTTARENSPGDAGKFVGECDRQQVAVEPLRCLLDPRP